MAGTTLQNRPNGLQDELSYVERAARMQAFLYVNSTRPFAALASLTAAVLHHEQEIRSIRVRPRVGRIRG
jgi:hypothetical protein